MISCIAFNRLYCCPVNPDRQRKYCLDPRMLLYSPGRMQHKPCSLILAAGLGKAGHRNIGIPILAALIHETLFFISLQIGSSSYTAFGVITSFAAA